MTKMQITLDNDVMQKLMEALKINGPESMPNTMGAMERAANYVQNTWKGYGMGKELAGVPALVRPSNGYANGIKVKKVGPFDYEIVNESKMAERIEEGTPRIDMKQTHPYGDKGRVAKKKLKGGGYKYVPYLIVPIRWGTPKTGFRNIMPESVYKIVGNKEFSPTITNKETHLEDNFWGEGISRKEYTWGDRLESDSGDEYGNMEGMSRMKDITGTNYYTFRVISADSPADSWILPAVPAKHVVAGIISYTTNDANDIIERGAREDLGL